MNRFAKWLIFGIAFALAPLLADYFIQLIHPRPNVAFDWHEILTKGELLLISSAIAGAAVGEIIGTGRAWLPFKIITGGACIIITIISALLYSAVASDLRLNVAYDRAALVTNSIYIFWATIIASAGCILAAED